LRTPLTSIRSFSEILHDNPDLDAGQRREFLAIIVKESERLSRLIHDMLDLAKIESGRLDWAMAAVDPGAVARDAAASLGQLFRDRAVRLDLVLPDGIPAVWADRDRLTQVVVNLLSNAVKFSPRGTGRVVLAAAADAAGVELTVSDNGPGVPVAERETIFERFRQGGDTLTAKPEGTGLGLAISRMIVEHFGGRLWAGGEAGTGAVFHLRLPPAAP
jgi:signal transduction histidine kinase